LFLRPAVEARAAGATIHLPSAAMMRLASVAADSSTCPAKNAKPDFNTIKNKLF
jgi:hypothetical protein